MGRTMLVRVGCLSSPRALCSWTSFMSHESAQRGSQVAVSPLAGMSSRARAPDRARELSGWERLGAKEARTKDDAAKLEPRLAPIVPRGPGRARLGMLAVDAVHVQAADGRRARVVDLFGLDGRQQVDGVPEALLRGRGPLGGERGRLARDRGRRRRGRVRRRGERGREGRGVLLAGAAGRLPSPRPAAAARASRAKRRLAPAVGCGSRRGRATLAVVRREARRRPSEQAAQATASVGP